MVNVPPGFVTRAARNEDVAAVAAIEADVFPDPWPVRLYVQEVGQPLRFQRVVCDAEGCVAAYLFACWQVDELHVLKVATHRLYHRRGLATALLFAAAGEVRAHRGRGLILEVRPSNAPAITLYQRLGYRCIGRRPRYYGDGEDALVLFQEVRAGVAETRF